MFMLFTTYFKTSEIFPCSVETMQAQMTGEDYPCLSGVVFRCSQGHLHSKRW